MNLLCPNCQKMLTVPEQYAGQLMKCPLCAGTFTVPALPSTAPPSLEPTPAPSPAAPGDVYSVRPDPLAALSSTPTAPPPASSPPTPSGPTTPAPTTPAPPPVGYTRTHTLWFSPKTLQWFAPLAVALILFLQFFTWVGIYPGGVPAVTQNAWQAAFGSYSDDPDVEKSLRLDKKDQDDLRVSVFLIFYVLLFLVNLVVTIGAVVLLYVKVKLPPQVERLLPYRWGIVAASNLVVFLLLVLQLLFGFGLESTMAAKYNEEAKVVRGTDEGTKADRRVAIVLGEKMSMLQRTCWLRLVVVLHLLAIFGAAMMYWLQQRGDSRPLPKIELVY